MGLIDSCGWDCYYFNGIVACNVSASCIHQVGQRVLPGHGNSAEFA